MDFLGGLDLELAADVSGEARKSTADGRCRGLEAGVIECLSE